MLSAPPRPTVSELQAMSDWGLGAEQLDTSPPSVDVWPENHSALRLFGAMLTQWRMGAAGPVGLDYLAIPAAARMARIRRREARGAIGGLLICEAEALLISAERREQ